MKNLKIALAQMEVVSGRPSVNADKCLRYISDAKNKGADIIVFSELCIPGYLIGDTWDRSSFLKECETQGNRLIGSSNGITVVFGNVGVDWLKKGEDGRPRKHNALFIAENGKLIQRRSSKYAYAIKTLQPNYREFDDDRYFTSARTETHNELENDIISYHEWLEPFEIDTVTIDDTPLSIGGILCEDGWKDDYEIDPMSILYEQHGVDIFINISCSPYTMGKNAKRNRTFGENASSYGVPIIYVNNVGCQNNGKTIYTFDGGSCVYDGFGNRLEPFEPFEEGMKVLDVPIDLDGPVSFGKLSPDELKYDGIPEMYKALQYGTRKFLEINNLQKVIIALSGGKDSALSAGIFADILPPEQLTFLNMPSKYNSNITRDIAKQIANRVGCEYKVTCIEDIVKTMQGAIPDLSDFMLENVQSRTRLQILSTWAAQLGAVFPCNSNKSEMTVGYCTFYGDLAGFMAPIADVWATQVYDCMHYYQNNINDIFPENIFTIPPSAELSASQNIEEGKGDPLYYPYHDKLFASWVEKWNRDTPLDNLKDYLNNNLEESIGWDGKIMDIFPTHTTFINDLERWWNLYNGLAVAKRVQAPPVLGVSRRICGGFDIRESIMESYYESEYQILKDQMLKE